MLGWFKRDKPRPAYDGPPLDPEWVRNKRGKFHRLMHLDATAEGLDGLSCIYVIWHSGVKPGWVYVGRTDDLGEALTAAIADDDIMDYEKNGGLYVTWSPVVKKMQNGVLRFLHDAMQPKVANPRAAGIQDGPVKVVVPKRKSG